MSAKNQHIIQKQIFDLTLRESKNSFKIQQKISTSCKERLVPLLNQIFDKLVDESEWIQIDHLEIDIGSISPEELERQLPEKIAKAIQKEIENLIERKSPELQRHSTSVSQFDAWLSYLEKGSLPWQIKALDENLIQTTVLENLAAQTASFQKFQNLILENPIALERLVRQSEEDFLFLILKLIPDTKQKIDKQFRISLEELVTNLTSKQSKFLFGREKILNREFFILFWRHAIRLSLEKKSPQVLYQLVFDVLEKINPQKIIKPALERILKTIENKDEPLPILKKAIENLKEQAILFEKTEPKNIDNFEKPEKSIEENPEQFTAEDVESEKEFNQLEKKAVLENEDQQESINKKEEEENRIEEESFISKSNDDQLESVDLTENQIEKVNKNLEKNNVTKETDHSIEDQSFDHKDKSTEKEKPAEYLKHLEALKDIPEGSAYYFQNAGLVLLHPFLKIYFNTFNLLSEEEFVDIESKERAVHLLQYLSSGHNMEAEFNLLFSKFLCALPLNFPIDRKIELTKKEKEEGDHLLQTVINHWGALGNVGPDSIREGFLNREGKLEKRSDGWHLLVERKTIDILLGKLPWGIGMVKLPWMEEMLTVEWA